MASTLKFNNNNKTNWNSNKEKLTVSLRLNKDTKHRSSMRICSIVRHSLSKLQLQPLES